MKSVKEINQEIAEIQNDLKENYREISDAKYTKLTNRIEFLKGLILYVNSSPSESFLQSEVERIKKSINEQNKSFEYWTKYNAPKDADPKKYRTMFNQVTGIAKFKKQLKTIEYLLAA